MPGRNLLRVDVEDGYYHVYSRGVNSQTIFVTDKDFVVFLSLLKRYLSIKPTNDRDGVEYPHLYGSIELISFCLMPNHFHLLIYQVDRGALQKLMRSLLTSYSRYFNKTHNRRGPLFESRYKASLISDQTYLEHISRYIHLNPRNWKKYEYSSLPYFIGDYQAEWLMPGKISELFSSKQDYVSFLENYVDYKRTLTEVKSELAI